MDKLTKGAAMLLLLCATAQTQAQTAPAPRRSPDVLGSPYANSIKGLITEKYFRPPVLDTLSINGRPDSLGALAIWRNDGELYKYRGNGIWQKLGGGGSGGGTGGTGTVLVRTINATGRQLSIPVYSGASPVTSIQPVTRNGSGMDSWHTGTGDTSFADYAHAPLGIVIFKIGIAGSADVPVTPVFPAVATPHLSAAAAGAHAISLSWTASDSAASYLLQYAPDKSNWTMLATLPIPTLTYQHTGLVAFSRYYYRIQAVSSSINIGNSGFEVDSATTDEEPPPPVTALPTPGGFAARGLTQTKDSLWWNDQPNETGYVVERSTDSASFAVLDTLPANTTTFIDSVGLLPSALYYYRLHALGNGTTYTPSPLAGTSARTKAIVFALGATHQGVSLATGSAVNNMTALNSLGTGYFRSSYNGGATLQYPSYTSLGYQVLLTYNDATPVKGGRVTPAAAAAFAQKLDSLLSANPTPNLMGATVLTEPNSIDSTDGYWKMTATQYIAILRAATTVLHAHGLWAAPGGLAGDILHYKVWEYYRDWGFADSAADFAARTFPPATNLNSWRSDATHGYRIRFLDTLLDSLPATLADYVNFHHYEQPLDADSLKVGINPLTFKQIARYLGCVTQKKVITDEVGLNNNNNPTNLQQLLVAGVEAGMDYMFWNGALPSSYGTLVNADGTRTTLGTAYKAIVSPDL